MQTANRQFWRGCAWGLVATLVMTVALLIAWQLWPSGVPQPLPLAITVGIVARVFNAPSMSPGILVLAAILQLAYGAVWGGLLEVSTRRVSAWHGIVVGLGLWLIMVIFYEPMAGVETFALATNGGLWIVTLLAHVLYGYTLGALLAWDERRHPVETEVLGV